MVSPWPWTAVRTLAEGVLLSKRLREGKSSEASICRAAW